ncbi:MAG: hypothetical protein Q8882_05430 [Bacillota bacterium]|nr:hypothetical protein [Bacillota bacterium]
MAENNSMNSIRDENREQAKLPFMCPMMYYGTYPMPIPNAKWPPNPYMFGYNYQGPAPQQNMYPMPGMNWYGGMGGYYNSRNVPFPECCEED